MVLPSLTDYQPRSSLVTRLKQMVTAAYRELSFFYLALCLPAVTPTHRLVARNRLLVQLPLHLIQRRTNRVCESADTGSEPRAMCFVIRIHTYAGIYTYIKNSHGISNWIYSIGRPMRYLAQTRRYDAAQTNVGVPQSCLHAMR